MIKNEFQIRNSTVDFLTKKQKVNEGEVTQYYVENSHPAIISSDVLIWFTFEKASSSYQFLHRQQGLIQIYDESVTMEF